MADLNNGTPISITFHTEDPNQNTDSQTIDITVFKKGEIFNPTPGVELTTPAVTFQWDQGSGVEEFYLGVGTTFESVSQAPWGDVFLSISWNTDIGECFKHSTHWRNDLCSVVV